MKVLLRAFLAGAVVALILAGTEAVAGYPRPSEASGAFFRAAFMTYLPLASVAALILSALAPSRGLDLWLPLLVGVLRMAGVVWGIGSPLQLALLLVALALLGLQLGLEPAEKSPPFLFGLTVGIVLPILASRVATGTFADRLGGRERAIAFGVSLGLLAFILLRAFVARWPRVGPVFLLGPVLSLALWGREAPASPMNPVARPTGAPRLPDIVLVVLDTARAQALASYGSPRNTMPNLEAFAQSATTFSRAWSDASWTLPAHASLFSGLQLTRHRYDSGFGASERSPSNQFLAARLQRAGYATFAVAANFAVLGREDPLLTGFEHVASEPLRPFAFRPWFFDLLAWFPKAPWLDRQRIRFPGPSMRANWVVDHAIDFWARPGERPRFLFVNLMEAHLPWIPEPGDLGRFGPRGLEVEGEQVSVLGRYLKGGRPSPSEVEILRARYEESLYSLDRGVGRLLEAVGSKDASREAVVVVTSDHGESLGEHDRFGHRASLDEEATRIPLMIRGPGLAKGEGRDEAVQLVDVFGYLAKCAGLEIESGLDARAFGDRDAVVIEHRPGTQGALPSSYPRGDLSALVEWPFKFIEGPHIPAALFDLSVDPGESSNLMAREPARAAAMRLRLRQLSGVPSSPALSFDRAAEERLRALGYAR